MSKEDEDKDEDHGSSALDKTSVAKFSFSVAKKAAFKNVSVASIITDFGAIDFIHHLCMFLDSERPVGSSCPTNVSTFDVYKQIHIILPAIPEVLSETVNDTIHTVKPSTGMVTLQGVKASVPGCFSTVLVQEHPSNREDGPLSSKFVLTLSFNCFAHPSFRS